MCNQGKKGEMQVTELISQMGQLNNSHVDFVRHTTTNTPDSGHDVGLYHTEKNFDEMIAISTGNLSEFSDPKEDDSKKMQTRIDVKNENNKITKPVAQKFIADIKKHPDCKGHLLLGDNGLTKGAEDVFREAEENYPDKKIGYISNEGVQNLRKAAITQLQKQNDKDKLK
ncbi:hypothetical protein [Neisseria sicca]|jgi:hypothetical protein|uniref:hypothetical protein n=1 Tax=Neisseria sicca TaxID=490 RepID=UPI00287FF529|nr:hypothetical protein [Neisseria sicca]